jgi:hypothetical protein
MTGYLHASGDDADGCAACQEDGYAQYRAMDVSADVVGCQTPESDPTEPGLCRWCSHTIEDVA